jgi:hypothetical protein
MIWRHPHPLPLLVCMCEQVVSLSESSCVSPVLLTDRRREGGGGWCWVGAISYDAEKALSSINYSILSEVVRIVNSSRSFEFNLDNAINIRLFMKTESPKAWIYLRWRIL